MKDGVPECIFPAGMAGFSQAVTLLPGPVAKSWYTRASFSWSLESRRELLVRMVRRKVDYVPGTQPWDTSYVAFEETSEAVARRLSTRFSMRFS